VKLIDRLLNEYPEEKRNYLQNEVTNNDKSYEFEDFTYTEVNLRLQNGLDVLELQRICYSSGLVDTRNERKTNYKRIGNLIYFLNNKGLFEYDNKLHAARQFKHVLGLTCSDEQIRKNIEEDSYNENYFHNIFGSFLEA